MALDTPGGREYFDNDFVMYREDVDLAWRAQLFGWESRYEPAARGRHVRSFHLGRDRRVMVPFLTPPLGQERLGLARQARGTGERSSARCRSSSPIRPRFWPGY